VGKYEYEDGYDTSFLVIAVTEKCGKILAIQASENPTRSRTLDL